MRDLLNKLSFIVMVVVMSAPVRADSITLHPSVRIESTGLTLADVATLQGDAAERFAELGVLESGADVSAIAMADIRGKLDEAGAHWGKLILRGPSRIDLIQPVRQTPQPAAPVIVDDQAQAQANPTEPVTGQAVEIAPPTGMRALLVVWLAERLKVEPQAVRLEAADPDEAVWTWNDLGGRFEFESTSGKWLGRVRLVVRRYRGEQIEEQRPLVTVAVQRQVVLAKRVIQRGQTLTNSDVKTETRWLESDSVQPLSQIKQAVGRSSVRRLEPGDILEATHVEAPRLVRRGQVVTVRCLSGSLVLKTVARAMEDGAKGQTIDVRNEQTRKEYQVTVTGPQQAIMRVAGEATDHALATGGSQ